MSGTTSFGYMEWTTTLRHKVCISSFIRDSLATFMIEYQKTMAIPKKLILEGQINELFKKEKEKAIREVNERN